MTTLIEVQELTKAYPGSTSIFSNLTLSINEGESLAIRGDNGAGKSTFLKILAEIITPTYGFVKHMKSDMVIGYVPEKFPYNIRFTAKQYLYHMGRIQGIAKSELHHRTSNLLKQFNMRDQQGNAINTFSKGMKQKIGMMQALLANPDILLLDEPLSGLDLRTQNDLESILYRLKTNGLTIIFTCHDKKLLNRIADRVITLNGKQGQLEYISAEKPAFHIIIEMDTKGQSLDFLIGIDGIINRERMDQGDTVRLEVNPSVSDYLLLELIQHGISIQSLYRKRVL
ncbi:ABC transporter ATP-binding protein [Virgibacillus halophilus]|uniref:ABC transporter ATP-binding protein n=1 Tax=Tigheibacillus halophilus TaxID=361280 RepID=A0ABU5C415_9BACI|nr:ABC transporter ATP-binding protein [Virgibacillus halophilus]